jgi:hypothetical protein
MKCQRLKEIEASVLHAPNLLMTDILRYRVVFVLLKC